jgi:hypothetical protein
MTAVPAGTSRRSAAWVASDYWEMAKRSLRHIRHDPEQLANVTVQPVLIVVVADFLLVTLGLSLLAALIGLLGKSVEAAQQLGAIIIIPIFFSSALEVVRDLISGTGSQPRPVRWGEADAGQSTSHTALGRLTRFVLPAAGSAACWLRILSPSAPQMRNEITSVTERISRIKRLFAQNVAIAPVLMHFRAAQ